MKKGFKNPIFTNVAALLLGAIVPLAFAPYEVFPLAVLALAGWLPLWLYATPKRAFWLGWLFGVGFFGIGVYWVFISIHVYGEVPSLAAGFITAGFIAILALFPAYAAYFTNKYFSNSLSARLLFAFPAIWVFSEWVRSWLFTGFPWLLLGYSQTNSPLKGYAPIVGVYGISLILAFSSASLVYAMIKFKQKDYKTAYVQLLLIVTLWTGGALLNLIPWTKAQGEPISVSLVQGNIPQEIKWDPEHLKLSFDRYQELTKSLWKKDNIIIWPEAAIPVPLQNVTDFVDNLDQQAQKSHAHLLLGIPIETKEGNTYYNAIISVGAEREFYLKRHLVPFGEYTPFSNVVAKLFAFMNIPMSDLVPGQLAQRPLIINNIKILPSICYEIAFPQLMQSRDESLNMLLTITNDAWFGESSAQAQHLQMAAMRALEFKRPVLFVSNSGITAIIGPDGNVQDAIPPQTAAVLNGTVQPMIGMTPWMYNGLDVIIFISLLLIILAITANKKWKNNTNHKK